jgi:hypothetical protein
MILNVPSLIYPPGLVDWDFGFHLIMLTENTTTPSQLLCFAGWLSECAASHSVQNNTLWFNVEYSHHIPHCVVCTLCSLQPDNQPAKHNTKALSDHILDQDGDYSYDIINDQMQHKAQVSRENRKRYQDEADAIHRQLP